MLLCLRGTSLWSEGETDSQTDRQHTHRNGTVDGVSVMQGRNTVKDMALSYRKLTDSLTGGMVSHL